MEHAPLTVQDVIRLGDIVNAAGRGKRVRWLNDHGDLLEGTARCIAREGGGFLTVDEDVRDGFLHVSGNSEWWLPVSTIVRQLGDGEFGIDP